MKIDELMNREIDPGSRELRFTSFTLRDGEIDPSGRAPSSHATGWIINPSNRVSAMPFMLRDGIIDPNLSLVYFLYNIKSGAKRNGIE